MQPSREGRFAAKTPDLVEEVREHVLRQIFRFGRVAEHAEGERIDAPEVAAIKLLEGVCVALSRSARQLHVARWLCFNFGRAHASPLAQSARRDCPLRR